MRTRVEVESLTPAQEEYLLKHLPDSREFPPNVVKMCVQFELSAGVVQHVEMAPREFIGLFAQLSLIGAGMTDSLEIDPVIAGVFARHVEPGHIGPCWSDCNRPEHGSTCKCVEGEFYCGCPQ